MSLISDIVGFSVLGFRSDIRIELQATVIILADSIIFDKAAFFKYWPFNIDACVDNSVADILPPWRIF